MSDITETDKEYLIKAELPEVKKKDVRITLEDGVIKISGERKQHKEHEGENEIRVESFYGTFERTFSLPDGIDSKNVSAEVKDGVPRVRIPKVEMPKARPLSIEVK